MILEKKHLFELEQATLRIAREKLSHSSTNKLIAAPRLGTGGDFEDIFLWDTCFTAMWARYFQDELPVKPSLDNLYRLQSKAGFISRQYSPAGIAVFPDHHPISFAPPVLSWAEWELYHFDKDIERLKTVYPALVRHHNYCKKHFRGDNGLYFGDMLGCGMDNLPRWPRDYNGKNKGHVLNPKEIPGGAGDWYREEYADTLGASWNSQGSFIDLSAQMALDAAMLSKMAKLLGDIDKAELFTDEFNNLSKLINTKCWSDKHGFYFDLGYDQIIPRFHIGAYWCLLAGLVPEDRKKTLIEKLSDKTLFNTGTPIPSLSFSDPDFINEGEYWKGSSWPPTTYMVLKGLTQNNEGELAKGLAEKYLCVTYEVYLETGTLWENLDPIRNKPGSWSAPDFCGWSGLSTVAVAREFMA